MLNQLAVLAMALQLLFPMGYMPGTSFWITMYPSGLPAGLLEVSTEHKHHEGATGQEGTAAVEAEKDCSLTASITYDSSHRLPGFAGFQLRPLLPTINNDLLFILITPTSRHTRAPPFV